MSRYPMSIKGPKVVRKHPKLMVAIYCSDQTNGDKWLNQTRLSEQKVLNSEVTHCVMVTLHFVIIIGRSSQI